MLGSPTIRWALVVAGLAVAASLTLYQSGVLHFNYPSEVRFPIRGVDVSRHQGSISWELVRSAGIDFALIKATEGRDLTDTHFAENWDNAGRAGVVRGAYHFFTFCSPGLAQAEHFLSVISDLPQELPPVADVEFTGNSRGWSSIDDIRSEISQFLGHIERQIGQTPTIYLTANSHWRIAHGHIERYPVWIRSIVFEPSATQYGQWAFWQFADNARIPGIRGPVDLNVFCCSREEFGALQMSRSAQMGNE